MSRKGFVGLLILVTIAIGVAIYYRDQGNPITNTIRSTCNYSEECILIDVTVDYKSCWPGACSQIDYASHDIVAVNKFSFESFLQKEKTQRPSSEECGPTPLCPDIQPLNGDRFYASCIRNLCVKSDRL